MTLRFENLTASFEAEETYHARPELSTSKLKDFMDYPEKYKSRKDISGESYVRKGTAVHDAMLSKAAVAGYTVIPKEVLGAGDRKQGNAWIEYEKANRGKVLLKESEVEEVQGMLNALHANSAVHDLIRTDIDGVMTEIVLTGDLYSDDMFITSYRMRLDYLLPGVRVGDVKSTSKLGDRNFHYHISDSRWAVQAAMYKLAADTLYEANHTFDFVVLRSSAPFMVRHYAPTADTLQEAMEQAEVALLDMFRREQENDWNSADWQDVHWF